MTEAQQAAPDTSGNSDDTVVVNLDFPIQRGQSTIASFMLRKPKGPVLYDFYLPEVVELRGSALFRLIPLISEPPLVKHEVENLDPSDLAEIGGIIRDFFMAKSDRKRFEALLASIQSDT